MREARSRHRRAIAKPALLLASIALAWSCSALVSAQPAPAGPSAPTDAASKNDEGSDARWAFGAQSTVTVQANAGFHAPYSGANSLNPNATARETVDATAFAGVRPWRGGEAWIDPEIDQGFGLSNTLGVAGFPSAEAYKVGAKDPYVRLQRLFFRQTLDLGGGDDKQDADLNAFAEPRTKNRLVLTVGKMGVGDIFDTNSYAHDPRADFLNWTIVDAGTFDYAADAWGYSYGVAAEWYTGDWTLRAGAYDLSTIPNGEDLETDYSQYQLIGELERRYALFGRNGKLKLTGFESRGRFGIFADAVRQGAADGTAPDLNLARRYRTHAGVSVDLEQPLNDQLGVFLRAGYADGHQQAYEFTDVDRTVSAGLSLSGKRWSRPDDTVALAGVVNGISRDFRDYLAAGGLGILIGDGRLPRYGTERILETYYSAKLTGFASVSADYQFIDNPAYNPQRGPVSVFALRLHLQGIGFRR